MEHYARLAGIKKSPERDANISKIIDSLGLTEQTNTIVGDIVSYIRLLENRMDLLFVDSV